MVSVGQLVSLFKFPQNSNTPTLPTNTPCFQTSSPWVHKCKCKGCENDNCVGLTLAKYICTAWHCIAPRVW